MEELWLRDLLQVLDSSDRASETARVAAGLERDGVQAWRSEWSWLLGRKGAAAQRGMPQGAFAWAARLNARVRAAFAEVFECDPAGLAVGLDCPFWSAADAPAATENGQWLHVDQNHRTGLTWRCMQGVLYVWPSTGDGCSTTVVWPRSHGAVYKEENFTCLPVTLRQMEAALAKRAGSGEELTFFGVEPKELIVVAAVESIARQGTSLEMTINDGTGRLKARYFVTDAQPDDLDRIVPGRYISAFGGLRAAPAVHFAINGLRLVESVDEVSYHVIEVAHAALRLQVGAKEVAKSEVAGTFQSPQKSAALATEGAAFSSPPRTEAFEAPVQAAAAPAATPSGPLRGAELKSAVLGLIRQTEGEAGVAVQDMAAKFSSVESDVRAAVAELVDSGDIFQTIDQDHFALLG
eukprot:SRR837773.3545.p1 GENE.SRR837773.3545~~SRR837773.3545.p1  ORF type:complete len:436 (-),score=90.30 SRR837773.3545:156-1379(-)